MILARTARGLYAMTTLRILGLSICLLLSMPAAFAERGFTGLRIGPNATALEVFQNAPAWQAGVRPGDVIESIDNVSTRSMQLQELSERITGPMGTRVTLVIVRGGKRYTCVVVRGSSKAATEAAAESQPQAARESGVYTGLEIADGNHISKVDANSPAWKVGLKVGDVIESINSSPTKDMTTDAVVHRVVHPVNAFMLLRVARGTRLFDVTLSGGPRPVAAPVLKKVSVAAAPPTSSTAGAPPIVAVEIFKNSPDTEKTLKQVKDSLTRVPARVQEALKGAGIVVLIVPNLIAVKPELANERPKSDADGGYESYAGLFYPEDKKVYICEKYRSSSAQQGWYLNSGVMHEVGRAFDHTGSFSKAGAFARAYEDDGKHLSSEQRSKFDQFLKNADSGRSELFAELFQAVLSPTSERTFPLSKAFPQSTAAVRQAVGIR